MAIEFNAKSTTIPTYKIFIGANSPIPTSTELELTTQVIKKKSFRSVGNLFRFLRISGLL